MSDEQNPFSTPTATPGPGWRNVAGHLLVGALAAVAVAAPGEPR